MDANELFIYLMKEKEKKDENNFFDMYKRSEDVSLIDVNGNKYFANLRTQKAYLILDKDKWIHTFTAKDIDFSSLEGVENTEYASIMMARYFFGIDPFEKGVAQVSWTLYPDGEYFADEDGFGVEPNAEVNVYAYIDENCRVLVPFTYMENREKREEYFEKAVKMVNGE